MPSATTGWSAVLTGLDRTRSRALATGQPSLFSGVYVVGSQPWRGDTALLAAYARRHLVVTGASERLLSVVVVRQRTGTVTLRVTEQLSASTAVLADGNHQPVPGASPRTRYVDLVKTRSGWRISRLQAE